MDGSKSAKLYSNAGILMSMCIGQRAMNNSGPAVIRHELLYWRKDNVEKCQKVQIENFCKLSI